MHNRSFSRREGVRWVRIDEMEHGAREACLVLVLLFSLPVVIVLVKHMLDSREQGPPFLMNQGIRGGRGGRRGFNRSRCCSLPAVTLSVHFRLLCGGFQDCGGWRNGAINAIGKGRGVLRTLRGMIRLRYCGLERCNLLRSLRRQRGSGGLSFCELNWRMSSEAV